MPAMHEVDHKIFGDDMQFVEVELDPGEAALAEAGAMFYMEDGISMETVFGDGSQQRLRRDWVGMPDEERLAARAIVRRRA